MTATGSEIIDFASLCEGQEIGCSPWIEIDQTMISEFGRVTRDPDPMHVDPEWAARNGPYGGTIAFGFLTVSLLTHMLHGAIGTDPARDTGKNGHFLNYGMDYLRLISPVRVGSRIRTRFEVAEKRSDDKGRDIVKFGCRVEIEGAERPALVAQWLAIWMPPEEH
jgi:acyl dehydratase